MSMGPASKSGEYFECNYCGKEFYKTPSQIADGEGKHCSRECRRKNKQVKCKCNNCGKTFTEYQSDVELGRGKYCSQDCRMNDWQERVECFVCSKELTRSAGYMEKVERTFCSKKCRGEWQSRQTAEDAPAWNGGYRYKGENWNRMRRKVMDAYDHSCAVCGVSSEELDRGPDVHHIKPIRTFGNSEDANTMENLVPLCRKHHTLVEGWNLKPSNAHPNA